VFACVGCLCDPIWQVTLRSCEMGFHEQLYQLYLTTTSTATLEILAGFPDWGYLHSLSPIKRCDGYSDGKKTSSSGMQRRTSLGSQLPDR